MLLAAVQATLDSECTIRYFELDDRGVIENAEKETGTGQYDVCPVISEGAL